MTEDEAMVQLAAVDRFRQAGAAAAEAIETLVAAMAKNSGLSRRVAFIRLGLTSQMADWCHKQRRILATGDAMQQATLDELLAELEPSDDLHRLLIRWCAS